MCYAEGRRRSDIDNHQVCSDQAYCSIKVLGEKQNSRSLLSLIENDIKYWKKENPVYIHRIDSQRYCSLASIHYIQITVVVVVVDMLWVIPNARFLFRPDIPSS